MQTFEERVKAQLGELLFINLSLSAQLEAAQVELAKKTESVSDNPATGTDT